VRFKDIRSLRMYDDLAYLWPLISPPADYEEEASFWIAALRSKLGPGRHHLLELGVGGGHNLSHLTAAFDATAVDLSEEMLKHSRQLNPDVEHLVGDMRSIRLNRKFDAVLIHDAIDYMLSLDDLRSTFRTAAAHLGPGGVFIVAPDYISESFQDGVVHSHHADRNGLSLTYLETQFDPDPADSTIESLMVYLIRKDGETTVELDRHVIGLFPQTTWIGELTAAGFNVEVMPLDDVPGPQNRNLFVCSRTSLNEST